MDAVEWLEHAYNDRIIRLRRLGVCPEGTPGYEYSTMFRTTRAMGLASIKWDHETVIFGEDKPYCLVCASSPDLIVVE